MLIARAHYLNALINRMQTGIIKVVADSNSKFLSKDIITEFRGRGDEIHVYPLSFKEFMSAYEGDRYMGWSEYITYGGLPLVLGLRTEAQKNSVFNYAL